MNSMKPVVSRSLISSTYSFLLFGAVNNILSSLVSKIKSLSTKPSVILKNGDDDDDDDDDDGYVKYTLASL